MNLRNTYSQAELQEMFMARIQGAGYNDIPVETPEGGVVVVLTAFNPDDYVKLLRKLHQDLTQEQKLAWKSMFTRSYFLLGSPEKVLRKDGNAFVANTSTMGVTTLLSKGQVRKYLSLFPLFTSSTKELSSTVIGTKQHVVLSPSCSTLQEVLVDLSHIVNELLLNNALLPTVGITSAKEEKEMYVSNPSYVRVVFDGQSKRYFVKGVAYEQ